MVAMSWGARSCSPPERDHRLDRGMRERPTGVGLEAVIGQHPTLAEALGDEVWIGIGRQHSKESMLRLENGAGSIEALPGEEGGKKPIHGRLAGMQRLAHAPVDPFEPGRLRAGRPDSASRPTGASSPNSLAAAAAAPRCPTVPVTCHPAS